MDKFKTWDAFDEFMSELEPHEVNSDVFLVGDKEFTIETFVKNESGQYEVKFSDYSVRRIGTLKLENFEEFDSYFKNKENSSQKMFLIGSKEYRIKSRKLSKDELSLNIVFDCGKKVSIILFTREELVNSLITIKENYSDVLLEKTEMRKEYRTLKKSNKYLEKELEELYKESSLIDIMVENTRKSLFKETEKRIDAESLLQQLEGK